MSFDLQGWSPDTCKYNCTFSPFKLTDFHISDVSSLEIVIWLRSYFVMFEKKPLETVCGPKGREI